MLSVSQIAGFFYHQYLLKESINILEFLYGASHQSKLAPETTTFDSMWRGGNFLWLANAAFGWFETLPDEK